MSYLTPEQHGIDAKSDLFGKDLMGFRQPNQILAEDFTFQLQGKIHLINLLPVSMNPASIILF